MNNIWLLNNLKLTPISIKTAAQAAKIAKEAQAKELVLTHISPRYKDSKALLEEAKAVFKQTEVAKNGMKKVIL